MQRLFLKFNVVQIFTLRCMKHNVWRYKAGGLETTNLSHRSKINKKSDTCTTRISGRLIYYRVLGFRTNWSFAFPLISKDRLKL